MAINLLPKILPLSDYDRRNKLKQELMRRDAKMGGKLFGPVPEGHNRQFFCLDSETWIWHEEWEADGQRQSVTTRYDVRPTGVIKSQDGRAHQPLPQQEANNLLKAARLYYKHVDAEYRRSLQTV